MKKMLILSVLLLFLFACENPDMRTGVSPFKEAPPAQATIILRGYSYTLYEVKYHGHVFIVSSKGGVIEIKE